MATTWAPKHRDLESTHIENPSTPPLSESELKTEPLQETEDEVLSMWSAAEQRRILRKVDYRLIPMCGLMYCVSLLDRTNLSNASIAG